MTMQHSTMPTAPNASAVPTSPAVARSAAVPPTAPRSPRSDQTDASVSELVRRAYDQVSTLLRHEIDFARAEMAGKAKRAATGAGLFGAAGLVAFFGLGALVTAAILGLTHVLTAWLAALVVGVALLALATVCVLVGRARLRAATPAAPTQSIHRLRDDLDAVTTAAKSRGQR